MATLGDVGAGNTLGRYELLTPIAQGGMALVWAARMKGHRGFQKIVAIKTMLPNLSDDPQFEQMFLAEAELAAKIRHGNVCEVIDLGEEDGTLYIVMEFVDGEPMTALLRAAASKVPMPISVAVQLSRDAALGLHAAHEVKNDDGQLVGLVHRDVSPHNILVGQDGVVKIVDFGIAKATTANDAAKTQAGQMKGKVPYMAPEQARGGDIDRRTDIFALGIVAYQLISGAHPFRQPDDIATLKRLFDATPLPRVSSVAPSAPASLDAAIAKALEKDASRRFATMEDFAEALDVALKELAGRGDAVVPKAYIRSVLGERADKRRRTIKEAIRVADERLKRRIPGVPEGIVELSDDALSSLPSVPSGQSQLTPSAGSFGGMGSLGSGGSLVSGSAPRLDTGSGSGPIADLGASDAAVVTSPPLEPGKPTRSRAPFVLAGVGALAIAAVLAFVALRRPSSSEGAGPTPASPSFTSASSAMATAAEPVATSPSPAPATAERPDASASTSASSTSGPAQVRLTPTTKAPPPRATPSATSTNLPRVRDPGF
ncbi:MAG: protein kinase [Polyangiaceae bacterium]|nr:protein kinase [Polyangiaceae bacterium]